MADWVGTCPKRFWDEWLEEGNCAGDQQDPAFPFGWRTSSRFARDVRKGDRFYVVSWGRLRGYATVTHVDEHRDRWTNTVIERVIFRADPVAVTLPRRVEGFRGLRRQWWARQEEIPFPDWKKVEKPKPKPRPGRAAPAPRPLAPSLFVPGQRRLGNTRRQGSPT